MALSGLRGDEEMKKRYYLSMLSIFPLVVVFDLIYGVVHQSIQIVLIQMAAHFILFGLISLPGIRFLYRPIDEMFAQERRTDAGERRIHQLTWYSTVWIFLIGLLNATLLVVPLFVLPSVYSGSEVFDTQQMPLIFIISAVPSVLFIFGIFPALICYFLINDFGFDLKLAAHARFQILYPPGKRKIGVTLFLVFLILGFLPILLAILEMVVALDVHYAQFTKMDPIKTVLVDRVVILVGTVYAIVLVARSFTRPLDLLLTEMNKVSEGDYSREAAVVTEDEIGVLTNGFNEMMTGLQEREVIRATLGKYVNPEVARVILDNSIQLEGETRACTILVTDIENYTTLSESLTPPEVVRMLNEYFSVVVDVIESHKGVVNKFIGDSIFAMFNVPLDDPDHALHAVQAALTIEKITATRTFGKNLRLNTRIGVNTGMVVAGNIGSADRMEYTVIGDDVNVAARLEKLNKECGTRILLGENTEALVRDAFDLVELGEFQLKGKEKLVKIYKLADAG